MPLMPAAAPESDTAPTSPINARPPLALSSDLKDPSLAAAVGGMSRSTSCSSVGTSDTQIIGSEDEMTSASSKPPAPPPHRVTFNEFVRVRLIPSRLEMAAEGTLRDTCWSPSDFVEFRDDFVARARKAGLIGGSPGPGRCILSFRGDALLKTVESEFGDDEVSEENEVSREGDEVGGRNDDADIQAVPQEIEGNESEGMERRQNGWLESKAPCNAGKVAAQMSLSQSSGEKEVESPPRGSEERERGLPGFVRALMGPMFLRTLN